MNDQFGNDREVRAMRQLITELRAEQPPPLDWERVERGLQASIESDLRQHGERWQRRALARAAGYAAAAASIGLLLTLPSSPLPAIGQGSVAPTVAELPQAVAPQPDGIPTHAVASLKPGSLVTTGSQTLRFVLNGVATWTLGPNSRAIVQTVEMPHVVSLEQGTLHAQVVPRTDDALPIESFAVESGGTRVAVHGTIFSVIRDADELTVEVSRGTVTVGPTGHRGLTTGHLLVAPTRAAFSLDGARFARLLPLGERLAALAFAQTGSADARSAGSTSGGSPQLPDQLDGHGQDADDERSDHEAAAQDDPAEAARTASAGATPRGSSAGDPTDAPTDLSLAQARSRMVACLGGPPIDDGAGGAIRVTIRSQVRLRLDDQRRIVSVQFNPPLKPELQARCASTVLGQELSNDSSTTQFSVTFRPQ